MRPFAGRRLLLVVAGGIAAYKSAYLARGLVGAGADVGVVLTESARRFVGAVTFEGITGRRVLDDLWERPMAHLDRGREADAAIVAPATADLLARMATGRADDLAAATLLAFDGPVLLCPAMNTRMWAHPATRRNVETLAGFGHRLVGPRHGELAEGEVGEGRMAEPAEILAEAGRLLETPSLEGRRVVVTAGPTRAPIDPVRFVSNRSSGRMGHALASAAWRRGAETRLITGPGGVEAPYGPEVVEVETVQEMLDALRAALEGADLLLMAAAVGDFHPSDPSREKIKKADGAPELRLEPGPDLLEETRASRVEGGVFTLGFALESGNGREEALRKLRDKGMDLVALNRVDRSGVGIGEGDNEVVLLDGAGDSVEIAAGDKARVADRILDRVIERMEG